MKSVYLLPFILLTVSCSSKKEEAPATNETLITEEKQVAIEVASTTPDTTSYTITVFPVNEKEPSEGYGFEIAGKTPGGLRIRQQNIPAVQGNRPFMSPENASATAELMLSKIKRGIVPPSVSTEELDSLGVIY